MTTETRPPSCSGVAPLSRPEIGLAAAGAFAAAGVGTLGLVASFDAVSAAAEAWGFSSPWMLPVGIDVAIPVFTVANLLLIRMDMALAWVRFVPWLLTLVTCGLNVAAGDSVWARVAHGTMPLLWVVFSEIGAHVYAARIGAATGRRMDKIRPTRWLLAPWSTFALWRRMTLWEITSYSDALARERERQLTRAELREIYGRRWRSKTPRRERVLLRLGELAPEPTLPAEAPAVPEADVEPEDGGPEGPVPPKPRKARKRAAKGKTVRTAAELLAQAQKLTIKWPTRRITAEALRTELRCSAANSRILRDQLLAERAETATTEAAASIEAVAA